ncbi:MAG: hypothetical protein GC150_11790 [Rhizobiales bacterium]|nr:hypothetical protein [Hyphomicrobiales bacterium]
MTIPPRDDPEPSVMVVGDGPNEVPLTDEELQALTQGLSAGLGEDDAAQLLAQLGLEEEAGSAATASAMESLGVWAAGQPALRELFMVERIADIIPAIVSFFRAMLHRPARGEGDDESGPAGAEEGREP